MLNMNRGSFFWQWVTAVTITMFLATMGAFVSMWSIGEIIQRAWGDVAMALVAGAIFGGLLAGGLSIGQAVVLARQRIKPVPWVLRSLIAGMVGMAIGMTVAFTFMDMETMPEAFIGIHFGLSVGVPIGQVQSQLLRQHVAQARLWILICTVAIAIAFAIGLPLSGEGREWLSIGVLALLTAVLSGAGMVWLLRGRETAVVA